MKARETIKEAIKYGLTMAPLFIPALTIAVYFGVWDLPLALAIAAGGFVAVILFTALFYMYMDFAMSLWDKKDEPLP